MGKCSICGKKIEYNKYKIVNGDVYCPDCIPKTSFEKVVVNTEELGKALVETEETAEVAKAEEEAKEQFEKEMAGHGADITVVDEAVEVDSKVMDRLEEIQSYKYKPEEKPKRKRGRKKNANL